MVLGEIGTIDQTTHIFFLSVSTSENNESTHLPYVQAASRLIGDITPAAAIARGAEAANNNSHRTIIFLRIHNPIVVCHDTIKVFALSRATTACGGKYANYPLHQETARSPNVHKAPRPCSHLPHLGRPLSISKRHANLATAVSRFFYKFLSTAGAHLRWRQTHKQPLAWTVDLL